MEMEATLDRHSRKPSTRLSVWMVRWLALAHLASGLILLLVAALVAAAMLRTLLYATTGTLWTNIAWTLVSAAWAGLPWAALGMWMMIVGRWIWSGHDRSRSVLLVTHGLLLVVGSVAVVIGVWATRAAERSGANGGGLLAPVAGIPLLIGGPVLVLAVWSIAVALTMQPVGPSGSRPAKAARPALPPRVHAGAAPPPPDPLPLPSEADPNATTEAGPAPHRSTPPPPPL